MSIKDYISDPQIIYCMDTQIDQGDDFSKACLMTVKYNELHRSIEEFLINEKYNLNELDSDKKNPLIRVCENIVLRATIDVVEILLKYGADANIHLGTIICITANNHLKYEMKQMIIYVLLENGMDPANVHNVCGSHMTVLSYCMTYFRLSHNVEQLLLDKYFESPNFSLYQLIIDMDIHDYSKIKLVDIIENRLRIKYVQEHNYSRAKSARSTTY